MDIYQCPHIDDAENCTDNKCYHGELSNVVSGISQTVTVLFNTEFGAFGFTHAPEEVQKFVIMMLMMDQE